MEMIDAGMILGSSDGSEYGLRVSAAHGAPLARCFFLGVGLSVERFIVSGV